MTVTIHAFVPMHFKPDSEGPTLQTAQSVMTLFVNEHWWAVEKPAGWLTVPGRTGAADPRPCLGAFLQKSTPVVLPVHRLDFEVSGVCLFAKSKEAHRNANGWFEHGLVDKVYQAESTFDENPNPATSETRVFEKFTVGSECHWLSRIVRGKRRSFKAPHGLVSETTAYLVGQSGERYFWEVHPKTGRPHQIRLELADHGYPIVGDELYGSKAPLAPTTIALRAVKLSLYRVPESQLLGLPLEISAPKLFDFSRGNQ